MQYSHPDGRDRIRAYLEVSGVSGAVCDDIELRKRVQDLFSFYGSDVRDASGEHVVPANPFVLDPWDEDFDAFVAGDAEEREEILERRIILRLRKLALHR